MIQALIIALVEAKKGVVKDSLGQCIAEMSAAPRFNGSQGKEIETIYGIIKQHSLRSATPHR
jgi:hypothetical protein